MHEITFHYPGKDHKFTTEDPKSIAWLVAQIPPSEWVHYTVKQIVGSAENRAELLNEDIEAYHLALDKHGVPRADAKGEPYSLYGRALRLVSHPNHILAAGPTAQRPQQAEHWTDKPGTPNESSFFTR